MNYKEAMEAAKKARLANSKTYDVPGLGGSLRFAPALAGPAFANSAAFKKGAEVTPVLLAQLLATGCINDDGSPFFANEQEATDFLGAISMDTMNFMLTTIGGGLKTPEALPKGNSETSQTGA